MCFHQAMNSGGTSEGQWAGCLLGKRVQPSHTQAGTDLGQVPQHTQSFCHCDVTCPGDLPVGEVGHGAARAEDPNSHTGL